MKKLIRLVPGVMPHQVRTAEVESKGCDPKYFNLNIADRSLRVSWVTKDHVAFLDDEDKEWVVAKDLTADPMQYKSVGEELTQGRTAHAPG